MKKLTREQMKNVAGGIEDYGGDEPGSPDAGEQGSYGSRKCCRTGTTNCSTCVNCYGDAKCQSGCTLTAC